MIFLYLPCNGFFILVNSIGKLLPTVELSYLQTYHLDHTDSQNMLLGFDVCNVHNLLGLFMHTR